MPKANAITFDRIKKSPYKEYQETEFGMIGEDFLNNKLTGVTRTYQKPVNGRPYPIIVNSEVVKIDYP